MEQKRKIGFQNFTKEQMKEIGKKGGKRCHELGVAHKFNSDTGRKAGIKGGEKVSADRAHMVKIGRNGGLKRKNKD